jgi:hypothetical protein
MLFISELKVSGIEEEMVVACCNAGCYENIRILQLVPAVLVTSSERSNATKGGDLISWQRGSFSRRIRSSVPLLLRRNRSMHRAITLQQQGATSQHWLKRVC